MESAHDQLVEALYQKGLALAEIESLKVRAFVFFKAMIVHYEQLQYPFMQNREIKHHVDDIEKAQT